MRTTMTTPTITCNQHCNQGRECDCDERAEAIVVTRPGALDERYTCDQLGVCQGRGNCDCSSPAPARAGWAAYAAELGGGNVWFSGSEPEPLDPPLLTMGDVLEMAAVYGASALAALVAAGFSVGYLAGWL